MAGRRILSALLRVLPDNETVEDMHSAVRKEAKANANLKLSSARVQDTVVRSGVLDSRQINHPATVTKEVFIRKFKHVREKRMGHRCMSAKHKMSAEWTNFWGTRD